MAYSRATLQSATKPTRLAFRLNPNRPKEKVICDFLNSLKDKHGASAAAKCALYQMITGCDWDSGQPLTVSQPFAEAEPAKPPPQIRDRETERQQLDNILAGFADWENQYTLSVLQAAR